MLHCVFTLYTIHVKIGVQHSFYLFIIMVQVRFSITGNTCVICLCLHLELFDFVVIEMLFSHELKNVMLCICV